MAITFQSPFKPITVPKAAPVFVSPSPSSLAIPKQSFLRCNTSFTTVTTTEPQPVFTSVRSFAPATVANLGPSFDFLGCAVDGLGDFVSLTIDPVVRPGMLSIFEIFDAKLSKDPLSNCAGIAAMKMLNIRSVGLSLSLEKGLTLGSGLGSSTVSAAVVVVCVNAIFGRKLQVKDLVLARLESEAKIFGYRVDNIASTIMCGLVLIRSYDPLELMTLKFPYENELMFVLVSPEFEAPTSKMRAALPDEIGMPHHVWNCSQVEALVASVLQGDVVGLGKALSSNKIVEPKRAALISGIEGVKKATLEAGAYGCTISGAGPTAVAVVDDEEKGKETGERMVEALWEEGSLKAVASVNRLDSCFGE